MWAFICNMSMRHRPKKLWKMIYAENHFTVTRGVALPLPHHRASRYWVTILCTWTITQSEALIQYSARPSLGTQKSGSRLYETHGITQLLQFSQLLQHISTRFVYLFTILVLKLCRPYSVTFLNQTPICEWCVGTCGSKNGHQKGIMFRRDWTTCSKFVNHLRLSSQHNEHLLVN